jgi:hypothetical protein
MPVPGAATPAPAEPIAAAHAPMPPPAAEVDNTPSPPHVTVLAVKTIAVPALSAPAETHARRRASETSMAPAAARVYGAAPERNFQPPLFFVLLFGLGITTFLVAIVIKYIAPQAGWPLRPVRFGADVRRRVARMSEATSGDQPRGMPPHIAALMRATDCHAGSPAQAGRRHLEAV